MAPKPGPGSGNPPVTSPPTGNALTDAQGAAISAAAAQAVNAINAIGAQVASDCLWPPSAQVTIPIIPGLWSQSFNLGCLLSRSEARALVGAGLVIGGLLIVWGGIGIAVGGEVLPLVLGAVGARTGAKAARRRTGAAPATETAATPAASDVALAA